MPPTDGVAEQLRAALDGAHMAKLAVTVHGAAGGVATNLVHEVVVAPSLVGPLLQSVGKGLNEAAVHLAPLTDKLVISATGETISKEAAEAILAQLRAIDQRLVALLKDAGSLGSDVALHVVARSAITAAGRAAVGGAVVELFFSSIKAGIEVSNGRMTAREAAGFVAKETAATAGGTAVGTFAVVGAGALLGTLATPVALALGIAACLGARSCLRSILG